MKLFVSYAREDKSIVQQYVNNLRRDLPAGGTFWAEEVGAERLTHIAEKVFEADYLLVFISANSCRSHFVLGEILAAVDRATILPVVLEPIKDKDECKALYFIINKFQTINAFEKGFEGTYADIISGIGAPCPVIAVMSTQGGTGKSTFLMAVAELIASTGHNVVIIDTDIETRGITTYLEARAAHRSHARTVLDVLADSDDQIAPPYPEDRNVSSAWDVTPVYLGEEQRFGKILLIPSRAEIDARDAADYVPTPAAAVTMIRELLSRAQALETVPVQAVLVDCEGNKNRLVSAAFVEATYGFIVVRPDPAFRTQIGVAEQMHNRRYPDKKIRPMTIVVNGATPDTHHAWGGKAPNIYFLPDDPEVRRKGAAGGGWDFEGVGLNNFFLSVLHVLQGRFSKEHRSLLPDQAKIWVRPFLDKLKTFPDELLAKWRFRFLTIFSILIFLFAFSITAIAGFYYYVTYKEAQNFFVAREILRPSNEREADFLARLSAIQLTDTLSKKVNLKGTTVIINATLSPDEASRLRDLTAYEPVRSAIIEAVLLFDLKKPELTAKVERGRQVCLVTLLVAFPIIGWGIFNHIRLRARKKLLRSICRARDANDEVALTRLIHTLRDNLSLKPDIIWLRDQFRKQAPHLHTARGEMIMQ